jgi:mRNA interferase MazF
MTTYNQGDVLLVPYLFTDQRGSKQRPSVVISGNAYNRTHPDVILAPITGHAVAATDEVSLVSWQAAGLLKPSSVKPVLSSFDTRLVRRRLGALTTADWEAVSAMFRRVLDLK